MMENNLPIQNETAPRPKRLLLYAHYDRDGKVDPHVVYQIKALHDFGISIIFISNSPVSEEDKRILSPFIADIRLRPDEGYDWTAWKETILALGIESLSKYDELIIMNDTCYGPVFPLEEMFLKMDKENVDFWGITENTNPIHIDHIQPYFCLFKKNLFTSNIFMNFWESINDILKIEDAVVNGELRMTKYFTKNGYQYSVYVNMENMKIIPQIGVEHAFVYNLAPWLVRTYRVPFAKIRAFQTARGKFNMGQELFIALKECCSSYPAHLIIDHLRRTRPLSWQKNLPGTLAVIDETAPVYPDPGLKIAVFAHIFYLDQVEEAVCWLSNIPYAFDLYVSTSSADKATTIRSIAENHAKLRAQKIEIRVMEDRGRDVAPWLLGFKDVQSKYDIALKFHLKGPKENPVFLWDWKNFILKSTLASPGYVSGVINLFKIEEKIGTLFHVFPPVLTLYLPAQENSENIEWVKFILQKCNIAPLKETSRFIFSNNIFWYRPKALVALFNSNIRLEDFPKEPLPGDGTIAHGMERAIPYIIQGVGYYYKLILPSSLLALYFQHYEDHIMNINASKIEEYKCLEAFGSKYTTRNPREIPIGRAFQIGFMSLYGHIKKHFFKESNNKCNKKGHKYNRWFHPINSLKSGNPASTRVDIHKNIQNINILHTNTEDWKHISDISLCNNSMTIENIKISSHISNKNFVLILPSINKFAFSAGPNTAFRFAYEIAKKGYNIQTISLDTPACAEEVLYNHLVSALGMDYEVARSFHVSDMTKDITLSHGDHVCATASWTLPAAIRIAKKTGTQYPAYFIQDCEPCFWGWGPGHACLMEGYAETFLPVINTKSLAEMLFNIGIDSFSDKGFRERALIFQPAVDRSLFYPEPQKYNKRILFVYTRFGELEQRNMYQLALEAVFRAAVSWLLPSETWEIHCYGSQGHAPVKFSSGIETVMLPSLDMAAYAREIRQASLILYLVLSPHTGYMPLEAAACGVPVVTNTYLNKTADYLRQISPLIHPARPTLDGVAEALATELLSLAHGNNGRKDTDFPAIPSSWSESFAPIMPKVQEWLQRP